ncbi:MULTISPECIES: L-dopachrome tautomerase-related protein [Rhizobium/Agrobacterium group]|uniref:L-dopachrome tautomerase-related protein n=1 Tax=Rhizobium/Agrobacterium group TaxID=227290 RepID=UPI002301B955|nr:MULTISPECIES: L-dopachrome tautomerase-related protein [Rhizobium/Agrobacterium group]MDA5635006.1 L-dopachrome tautomerase-related protein [Agrobacterium sp. ST15.16.024]MDF1890154.1 L-dopachrome tautomerase-related protein [Rhizobium rhizogenes]
MIKHTLSVVAISFLFATAAIPAIARTAVAPQLDVVAALESRPGNVAVSSGGRVFTTLHPLGSPAMQLVEIVDGKPVAYPNAQLQRKAGKSSDATFDTLLGLVFDKNDRLWVMDMGLDIGKTRVWAIDIGTGAVVEKIEVPADVAPKGSFAQDLAVDETNGWVYLADIANPGIIAINLKDKSARRFGGHPSLQAEDIDMVIDGKVTQFGGKPARVAVDPITLSSDRETLFFGPMNGTSWYQVPANLFHEGKDDAAIGAAIRKAADKPVSDGAVTDAQGNHYFGDLQNHAVVKVQAGGTAPETLVKDKRILWPDNIALGPQNWIYVSANQLNSTPAFTGAGDEGKPPFFIYRFKQD